MRRLLIVTAVLLAALLGVPAVAGATTPGYVALGDSYSSGLGTGSYTLNAACKRGTKAYPYVSGVTAAKFAACTGAAVSDVTNQLNAVLPATEDPTITLVTLTVGGNDIGFSTVVSQCTAFSSNTTCTNAVNTAVGKIPAMQGRLVTLLGQIRAKAPKARVVLLGYPYLYSTNASCGFGQPSLTKREALRFGADKLNTALGNATGAVPGTQFVDVRNAFTVPTDHTICATSANRWINGLTLFNSAESFHPNTNGHLKGYFPALSAALAAVRA